MAGLQAMQSIHPHPINVFGGSPLDRVDFRRRDTGWIAGQLAKPDAKFLPVWRSRNFVAETADGLPCIAAVSPETVAQLLPTTPWALLGLRGDTTYFAIDLSRLDTPLPPEAPGRFEDLRRVGSILPAEDAAVLAHARGLMHWRAHHKFCPVCGAACQPEQAGHVMACTGCGTHHFPRTDAAVIMLVTHGDRALLGHHARFRDTPMFSTLAGFLEPGETLEEAVAREVCEESGVRVGNVRYQSSQPWPFPAGIMLGFRADAITEEITFDGHELLDVRWFTRDDLENPKDFTIPPKLSIARRLIDDWRAG
jgi:NAD+ diphosphatase